MQQHISFEKKTSIKGLHFDAKRVYVIHDDKLAGRMLGAGGKIVRAVDTSKAEPSKQADPPKTTDDGKGKKSSK